MFRLFSATTCLKCLSYSSVHFCTSCTWGVPHFGSAKVQFPSLASLSYSLISGFFMGIAPTKLIPSVSCCRMVAHQRALLSITVASMSMPFGALPKNEIPAAARRFTSCSSRSQSCQPWRLTGSCSSLCRIKSLFFKVCLKVSLIAMSYGSSSPL